MSNDVSTYLNNSKLHLIVLATEKCNLRCNYCYETFKQGKMPQDIVNGIKALIDRRASELTVLEIGWFGGEPLLNIDAIEEIGNHAKRHEDAKHFKYVSSMSTNAVYLNNKNFERVIDAGVSTFQITLDGVKDKHDLIRKGIHNQPTYSVIWSNLINIKKTAHKFTIGLRIHVSKANLGSIEYLFADLVNEFEGDDRFNVYIKAIEDLGGCGHEYSDAVHLTNSEAIVQHLEKLLPSSMLIKKEQSKPNVCYAAAGNSLVIRSNGEIAKCTVALGDERNTLGRINPDGTIDVDNKKFGIWVSQLFDAQKAKCPLMNIAPK